ncbi:MAG: hypothetical protein KF774_03115 [Planctomyces sp.]|nr:hypothetical protein [Planctomyces sp.]
MDVCRRVWTTILILFAATAWAQANDATYRTPNFVVHAPTTDFARQVGETAELWREELAVEWLGEKLPDWYEPCQVTVKVGQIGAGGATTFSFERGEVFGWRMRVQGTEERILDSVIPHEVSHTIFACHFRRPLPRWADEGAATLVEHHSERMRQVEILQQVTRNKQRIPLNDLLRIDEYPKDMQQVLALYAQGYSLADFLVQQHGDQGRAVYLAFLKDALASNWETAFRKHYGFATIHELDSHWNQWVIAGSPPLRQPVGSLVAKAPSSPPLSPPASNSLASDRPTQSEAPPRTLSSQPETVAIRGQSESASPLPRLGRAVRGAVSAAAAPASKPGDSRIASSESEEVLKTQPGALPQTRRIRADRGGQPSSAAPQRRESIGE